MRLLALALLCLLLVACDVTATVTPEPTWTPLPTLITTPIASATRTETATETTTATATETATPWPTCAPQMTGDAILSCFEDVNDDKLRDPGEPGISCTVAISYTGQLPPEYAGRLSLTSNEQGNGGWSLLPGTWLAVLLDYTQGFGYVPYGSNDQWWYISIGDVSVLSMRFWRLPQPSPVVTTTPGLVTPTVTPAPSHQCYQYWSACMAVAACPAGTAQDRQGACGAGFLCCQPEPTPTPTQQPVSILGWDTLLICAPPYASVSLYCCSERGEGCRPIACCGGIPP